MTEKVSSKQVKSSAPETAADHLIYTQEHFALKESLRKVCSTANTWKFETTTKTQHDFSEETVAT